MRRVTPNESAPRGADRARERQKERRANNWVDLLERVEKDLRPVFTSASSGSRLVSSLACSGSRLISSLACSGFWLISSLACSGSRLISLLAWSASAALGPFLQTGAPGRRGRRAARSRPGSQPLSRPSARLPSELKG